MAFFYIMRHVSRTVDWISATHEAERLYLPAAIHHSKLTFLKAVEITFSTGVKYHEIILDIKLNWRPSVMGSRDLKQNIVHWIYIGS